jgi:hypothetical protein
VVAVICVAAAAIVATSLVRLYRDRGLAAFERTERVDTIDVVEGSVEVSVADSRRSVAYEAEPDDDEPEIYLNLEGPAPERMMARPGLQFTKCANCGAMTARVTLLDPRAGSEIAGRAGAVELKPCRWCGARLSADAPFVTEHTKKSAGA